MKTPDQFHAEFDAGVARFDRLIPPGVDELSLVLKGHLLIEEQLRAITRSLVANPEHFDRARLTFANALHLARAVAGHFNEGACWAAAEKLNAVRNKLAHQAEPMTSAELFAQFFEVCERDKTWVAPRALPRGPVKLRMYISSIWSTLSALRAVVEVCAQTVPSPIVSRGNVPKP